MRLRSILTILRAPSGKVKGALGSLGGAPLQEPAPLVPPDLAKARRVVLAVAAVQGACARADEDAVHVKAWGREGQGKAGVRGEEERPGGARPGQQAVALPVVGQDGAGRRLGQGLADGPLQGIGRGLRGG